MRRLTFVLLLACAPVHGVTAATNPADFAALLDEAVGNVEWNFGREWAFTESLYDGDTTYVGRYDPSLPAGERWQLLSVDGRAPTGKDIEDYLDEKAGEEPGVIEEDGDFDGMVEADTLALVEETADYWLFSFIPSESDDDEEFVKHLNGTLRISKPGRYLEYIDLRNEKPIRPIIGVKIKRMHTRFEFGPAAAEGPVVPRAFSFHVKGSAYVVVRFNESESMSYSEFQYVGRPSDGLTR